MKNDCIKTTRENHLCAKAKPKSATGMILKVLQTIFAEPHPLSTAKGPVASTTHGSAAFQDTRPDASLNNQRSRVSCKRLRADVTGKSPAGETRSCPGTANDVPQQSGNLSSEVVAEPTKEVDRPNESQKDSSKTVTGCNEIWHVRTTKLTPIDKNNT